MYQDITKGGVPVVAFAGSVMAHLPDVISVLVGIAALIYYYLVITKLLKERKDGARQTPHQPD